MERSSFVLDTLKELLNILSSVEAGLAYQEVLFLLFPHNYFPASQ